MLALPAGASAAPVDELDLIARERISPRLLELTFETPAIAGPVGVRVLLPAGYAGGERRYPSLYLLHGAGYDHRGWTEEGRATEIIGDAPLIVVMPDGGGNGYYSDWYNGGAGGPPQYETFHVRQVLPWIDHHLRTLPRRGKRAIAGFSMSGLGALSYAARNPGLFAAAASFSGALDTNYPFFLPIGEGSSTFDGGPYAAIWGPRLTEEVRWRAHNPWDLAENLRGIYLEMRTGNGLGGGEFGGPVLDPIEFGVNEMNGSFDARLDVLGIPHVFEDYGPGAHEFPYYSRDLEKTLPGLLSALRDPSPAPSRFAHRAVDPTYRAYGYDVRIDRPALEFSRLAARRSGRRFALSGSGDAVVMTPPVFRPSVTLRAVVDGEAGHREILVTSDRRGRIRVPFRLGPGNPVQQFRAGAVTRSFTTRVSLSPLAGPPRG